MTETGVCDSRRAISRTCGKHKGKVKFDLTSISIENNLYMNREEIEAMWERIKALAGNHLAASKTLGRGSLNSTFNLTPSWIVLNSRGLYLKK